jgi:predicted Fe-Mo cluster-binding NifX family protein
MKIAIATDKGQVSEHFGRCPEFTIAEIKEGKLINKKIIKNPGHRTGFLPKYLKEKNVEIVITGGAGFRAKEFFEDFGIKLISGISGDIDKVINNFINKEIEDQDNICEPGAGKGYGLDKEDRLR